MHLDENKHFRDIFPSPRDLKERLICIVRNTSPRLAYDVNREYPAIKQHWASLRCLAFHHAKCRHSDAARQRRPGLVSITHRQSISRCPWFSIPGDRSPNIWPSHGTDRDTFRSEREPDRMSSAYSLMPVSIDQLDETVRKSTAPCMFLRRAIRHVAANTLKYIWIDQECVKQQHS
jgi:hypothetical protein